MLINLFKIHTNQEKAYLTVVYEIWIARPIRGAIYPKAALFVPVSHQAQGITKKQAHYEAIHTLGSQAGNLEGTERPSEASK